MDTTFSDDEKRFVLGEIIKVSSVDVHTLVEFIKSHNIEPNWMSMQLPNGRNMNQCFGAVDNMFQFKYPPPNFKRKSLSDLVDHPAKRRAVEPPPLAPAARNIQPRPPSNGYAPPALPGTSSTVTVTGKKRGRPSKADKEAQARAVYSRSTEYAPITPAPLAPMTLQQPQREYASSPGYEIAGSPADKSKKRGQPGAIDSPQLPTTSFPLPSPASVTNTPRTLPGPPEQDDRANLSPRDRGPARVDARSPPLLPYMQQPPEHAQTHAHMPARAQAASGSIPRAPRPIQPYDHYRGPDPIFPDRDRMRSMPDQVPRSSPAPPLENRS
ncbi:hypothetical protein F4778DRAFT_139013 [Xylariomycetidae sp. FL2044]|nr:hypothetical protein F4778DRAFT_139013 [Xylariomycetidae sp. FL2044]